MDSWCRSQALALKELEEVAPEAPFLALGQTVFWDEPMKGIVIQAGKRLGINRRFIAGVHDTDYFAKLSLKGKAAGFKAFAHNDTTTKDLWSAAAEFSSLFGSETVVTKEVLLSAGAKVARIEKERPGWLDEVTEAYGWRGVVSFSKGHKIIAEKPLDRLFPELFDTFEWAIDESLALISGNHHQQSLHMAERLKTLICDEAGDRGLNLADYYKKLLPPLYDIAAGEHLGVEATATTELLAFNPQTAQLPRFGILGHFLKPETRPVAEACYDAAVSGTEMYTLDRFGVGAMPFDVVIPRVGRGTLRLGTRGGVIMTPDPVGFSFKTAPSTPLELAEMLEKRFGEGIVVIGKAVTLVGMLAAEHIFVFHEGASGYIPRSQKLFKSMRSQGMELNLKPMLRVYHRAWDALEECCAWVKLPEPMRRPFGTDELSAPSFAVRWKEVGAAQKEVVTKLGQLRRPLSLVQYLQESVGGHWKCLATEYEAIHKTFSELREELEVLRRRKKEVLGRIKELNHRIDVTEKTKGDHWRDKIFEKEPTPADLSERQRLQDECERIREEIKISWDQWRGLQAEQDAHVQSAAIVRAQERRRDIALEAELMRTRLIRSAIVASLGLERAGRRPSAWWFPLVCPDGAWWRANARRATFRIESL